jgi:hypothetical protein
MRKRHDARPRLEAMEPRVVLSGVGVHNHAVADRAVAAHLVRLRAAGERLVAMHAAELVHVRGEHRHIARPLAIPHKTSASNPKSAGSLSSDLNNFFKSVFGGL